MTQTPNAPGYSGPAIVSVALFCSNCGNMLQTKAGGQVSPSAQQLIDRSTHLRSIHAIGVEPCQACISKQLQPAKALTNNHGQR